jgi:hypothetical protein
VNAGQTGLDARLDIGDRAAIVELIARHAWLIDHGRAGEVTELFAEDGALYGAGPDKRGRAAIAAWAQQRAAMTERRSRHVQSNILLEAAGPDQAQGTVLLTLYRHDGPGPGPATPLLVAEYADRYRRGRDGAWRFAERRLDILFGSA